MSAIPRLAFATLIQSLSLVAASAAPGPSELTGAQINFHFGVTAKSHIHIYATKVHKYRLECKEGGTVVVRFQVQCRPTEGQAGKFTKLLTDKQVILSVAPPDAGGASDDEKK